jgi:hypothetical protein
MPRLQTLHEVIVSTSRDANRRTRSIDDEDRGERTIEVRVGLVVPWRVIGLNQLRKRQRTVTGNKDAVGHQLRPATRNQKSVSPILWSTLLA